MQSNQQAVESVARHPDAEPLKRHSETRKRSLMHAFVSDFDDLIDMKCVIRDISKGGCRIVSSYIEDLPRLIRITPEGFGRPMVGKIIWRTSNVAGIQFISAAEAKAMEEQVPECMELAKPVGFLDKLLSFGALPRSSGQATRAETSRHAGLPTYGTRVMKAMLHPLQSIKGLLGLLMGDTVRPIPRRAKSVLAVAHQSAANTEAVLGEALKAENIESGAIPCRPEPLEIVEFVRDTALACSGFAAQSDVRFDVVADVREASVKADAARLHEVMTHLLLAAARYSPVGEKVVVGVRRNGESIRVSVLDKGAGSNVLHGDADGRHVFQPGDGTELGLDVVRAILSQHGAELHVEVRARTGMTVWFELPEIEA